ncbi:hypothetical protein GGQ85_002103 [Nitrobacter vulgaris]|jgi:hypothetical protein|nr:hypothetical protein [Nitrobacter vulgaris]MDR6304396.1 hypothetical protein [Nitrobacter vulgaris]
MSEPTQEHIERRVYELWQRKEAARRSADETPRFAHQNLMV